MQNTDELEELLKTLGRRHEQRIEANRSSGLYKTTSDWQLDSEQGHQDTPTLHEKTYLSEQYATLVDGYLQDKEQFEQLAPNHDSQQDFEQVEQRYVRLLDAIELWHPDLSHLERPH